VMTIAVDDETAGGVLLPDSAFFEFIPAERPFDPPLCAWELAIGESYRVIVTTHAGLYRYDLGDVVRVERMHLGMPLLSFLHRAGRVYSFTGEKLTELQVTVAVRTAADIARTPLISFTAVPVWNMPPRYDIYVEPGGDVDPQTLAVIVDDQLCAANMEYASKRESGRLAHAGVVIVAPGTFARLRREYDAQYKETHLATDPDYAQVLTNASRSAPVPGPELASVAGDRTPHLHSEGPRGTPRNPRNAL
jgi:hypothetical protein